MPNCIVPGCRSKIRANTLLPEIGFHRLPKEAGLKSAWLDATGRSDLAQSKRFHTVCSLHFAEGDYEPSSQLKVELMRQKSKRYLRQGVIPGLKLDGDISDGFHGGKRKREQRPTKKYPPQDETFGETAGRQSSRVGNGSKHVQDGAPSNADVSAAEGHDSGDAELSDSLNTSTNGSARNQKCRESDDPQPRPAASSSPRLPIFCCQAVFHGVDSPDYQHSGHVKKEFWDEQSESLIQDEQGARAAHLAQQTDQQMQQGGQMLRNFSTVDCLEGVKVELTDPTDLMMLSHARRIRGFSRKRQLQLEMKIARLVMEAEMEEVEAEEERDMTTGSLT